MCKEMTLLKLCSTLGQVGWMALQVTLQSPGPVDKEVVLNSNIENFPTLTSLILFFKHWHLLTIVIANS